MYVPYDLTSLDLPNPSGPPVCIITTVVYGQHLGYRVFVVRDAIGSHNLLSWDGKRGIKGTDLVESACDLMADALAVVIESKDISP